MERRVGFVTRTLALLVDWILMAILSIFGCLALGGLVGGPIVAVHSLDVLGDPEILSVVLRAMLAGLLVSSFLYSLMEGLVGTSPGKWIFGLRVGTEDGHVASIGTCMIRWIMKNGFSPILIMTLFIESEVLNSIGTYSGMLATAGCFLVLGSRRQALHDRIARTAVFRKWDLRCRTK